MDRLVAFGCSYTYGHGLPDCIMAKGRAGKRPSKFAWPYLLAKKLDKRYTMLASRVRLIN